jgi:type III restriction enzyme
VESQEGDIEADFSSLHNFQIDGTKYPMETTMQTAFSNKKETMAVRSVKAQREQELFYLITKELIGFYFSDLDGKPYFQKFNKLKKIVARWYQEKVVLLNITDPDYKKILFFVPPKEYCDHINLGIMAQQKATDVILPIFNHYNRFGSSRYVHGQTSKEVYPTSKSHVNFVVADTESWEQIAAKTFEELEPVQSYVKNAFLGFQIPYVAQGKDRYYFPDFIARCVTPSGEIINLIVEITGMNQDKAEKRWYVENRWLPAVNAVRERYDMGRWEFVEIANDIRDIKNQLLAKINSL